MVTVSVVSFVPVGRSDGPGPVPDCLGGLGGGANESWAVPLTRPLKVGGCLRVTEDDCSLQILLTEPICVPPSSDVPLWRPAAPVRRLPSSAGAIINNEETSEAASTPVPPRRSLTFEDDPPGGGAVNNQRRGGN